MAVDLTTAKSVYLKDLSGNVLLPYVGDMPSARNIGELVYSTLPLTDSGLHLLDGSLISGSGSYAAFVSYIATLASNVSYSHLFVSETNWQQSITTYGVCGKFVYDSTNNTVRLPKITGIIEGTVDLSALGALVQESLPNITGLSSYMSDKSDETSEVSGAFYNASNSAYARLRVSDTVEGNIQLGFDASRSSSVYQNNAKVQPQTIKAFVYMVIATSAKSTVQVNIDNVATDLNGKADRDLSNLSSTGITSIIDALMPDYSAGISFTSGYVTTRRYIGYAKGNGTVKVNNVEVYSSASGEGHQFTVPNGATLTTTGTFTTLALYPLGA